MKQFILILFIICLASVAWSDDGVDITDPAQLAALTELQMKIDKISSAVTACVKTGKNRLDCLCDNEALVLDFNKSVKELFVAHPELKTLDITRFKGPDGLLVSQSLSGIKAQASVQPPCK